MALQKIVVKKWKIVSIVKDVTYVFNVQEAMLLYMKMIILLFVEILKV